MSSQQLERLRFSAVLAYCLQGILASLLLRVISAHLTSSSSSSFPYSYHHRNFASRNDMWSVPYFPFSFVVSAKKPPASSFSQCVKAMFEYMSEQIADTNSSQEEDDVLLFQSPFLEAENDVEQKIALVVLNTPIRQPPSPLFQYLWNKASFRICADGGANRLYHASRHGKDEAELDEFLPDVIRGDLDSLLPAVSEYYQSRGTRIERDPDQDTNDLDKALQAVLSWSTPPYRVLVYGAFGGRFDQEMASIQALYKWREAFQNQLYLYDDHTCAFLLAPGQENRIQCRYYGEGKQGDGVAAATDGSGETSRLGEGPTCGLIPISGRCEFVTTTGLKWNLEGNSLEFGGLVSSSNRVMESTVTVRTSHPLVFTAEVFPGDDQTF